MLISQAVILYIIQKNTFFLLKHNPVERVAFDMALVLASKIEAIRTPDN